MWRTLLVLLTMGGLALAQNNPPAGAATNPAVAKFRAAVRLPQVAFNLEPQFGRYWGVTAAEDVADPSSELARLATGLKNEPSEAPIRLRMLRLALLVGDTNAASHRDAAVAGFQTLAKSTPGDPAPGIGLARTLLLAADEVPAEKLLRILADKHPKNWQVWILLGEALGSRSLKVFTAWGTNAPPNPMAAYVAGALKPQGDLKAARALFDEANQCIEQAEKLAPDEPRMWAARLPFALDRDMRRQVLADPANPDERQAAVSLLNQATAAGEVEAVLAKIPQDYRLLGLSIYLRILPELAAARVRLGISSDGGRAIDSLRSDTRTWVRERQARLEGLATNELSAPESLRFHRAGAAEMTATYYYVLWGDPTAAERLARLALVLDPARQRAFELVVAGMVNRRRWSELEAFCEKRIQTQDSPLPRLLVAKSQFNDGRKEAALATLTAASEKFPRDRLLLAGVLAARLAVGTRQEDPKLIARLTQLFPDPANTPDDTDGNHSVVISALISQAVDGELGTAKKVLRSMVIADPNDDYASAVLEIVRANEKP